MAILEDLNTLKDGFASVETVVYLDIRSGTVLGKSNMLDQPQEALDGLCEIATEVLDNGGSPLNEAVYLTGQEALVLCRAPGPSSEALCLLCAPDADVLSILEKSRQALEDAA